MPGLKPFLELIRKVNGKSGAHVVLEAGDVGAYTKDEVDAALAAVVAFNPITGGTAVGGQTTFAIAKALPHGAEDQAEVVVGGQLQDPTQYTFDGTTAATLGFAMMAGDRWRALVFGA